MLKKYSLKALEKAINHALSLDSAMPEKIATLHGKLLEIVIAPLNVNFYMLFEDHRLKLLPQRAQKPDTIIHSSPLGLIRLSFLPASKARSLFNDKIRLSGDIELGQAVKKMFDELDIDWEGHLALFTGDLCAHHLGSLFRKARNFQRDFRSSMRLNLREYLHEEKRLFPCREELNDFFAEIDETVLDVERLEAQIQLLMASHETD